jgi:hypothetical protein
MAPPVTLYPVAEREIFIVREAYGAAGTYPGTVGVPVPLDIFKPSDKPVWIEDGAWRGDMGDVYNVAQGPLTGGIDVGGHVYGDTFGHFLYNLLGDYTTTGTPASPSGTTNAGVAAGAIALPVASGGASFTAGMYVWIEDAGTPALNETCLVGSGSTATSVVLASPGTRFAHLTATPFTNTAAPYTHVFAKLNTATSVGNGAGQPATHCITDRTGVPATGLARQYTYGCLGEIVLTGNAEKFLDWTGKIVCQVGVIPGSAVQPTAVSSVQAYPSWRSVAGVGGPASGGTQRKETAEWQLTLTRTVRPMFTNQGSQQPYVIARGKQGATGKLTVAPAIDESYLVAMLANTQPQLQFLASNGLAGANLVSVQADILLGQYQTADIEDGGELFGYTVPFKAVHTAASAGGITTTGASGGYGAVKITLVNNIALY